MVTHRLVQAAPTSAVTDAWGRRLDLFREPGPVTMGVHGCDDAARLLLNWVENSQTENGLIVRDPDQSFFGGMGFLDWSDFPFDGRFEELS
ncbi:MAG: hypothetical protein AAF800_13600 [Planctomycetota bacterium]